MRTKFFIVGALFMFLTACGIGYLLFIKPLNNRAPTETWANVNKKLIDDPPSPDRLVDVDQPPANLLLVVGQRVFFVRNPSNKLPITVCSATSVLTSVDKTVWRSASKAHLLCCFEATDVGAGEVELRSTVVPPSVSGDIAKVKVVVSRIHSLVPVSERHIVAFGGGTPADGFAPVMEYVLGLNGKKHSRMLVLATAVGDDANYTKRLSERIGTLNTPCELSFLDLFDRTPVDLRSLVLSQDIIWVCGGNTKSMLAVWREYGVDQLLREAWGRGIILSGSSAGGICWFQSCVTDSYAESFTALSCLGILKGSCCPHHDGEIGRRDTYHSLISSGQLPDGYAIDEATGLHFVGTEVKEIVTVSHRQNACAYKFTQKNGGLHEDRLVPTRLHQKTGSK